MSFICNKKNTYILRIIILDVAIRLKERERKREAILTASCRFHQKRKKKEPLAVVRLFFLTSNLLLPPTVYIYKCGSCSFSYIYINNQPRCIHRGLCF